MQYTEKELSTIYAGCSAWVLGFGASRSHSCQIYQLSSLPHCLNCWGHRDLKFSLPAQCCKAKFWQGWDHTSPAFMACWLLCLLWSSWQNPMSPGEEDCKWPSSSKLLHFGRTYLGSRWSTPHYRNLSCTPRNVSLLGLGQVWTSTFLKDVLDDYWFLGKTQINHTSYCPAHSHTHSIIRSFISLFSSNTTLARETYINSLQSHPHPVSGKFCQSVGTPQALSKLLTQLLNITAKQH